MAFPKAINSLSFFVLSMIFCLCASQTMCRSLPQDPMVERHEQWMLQHGRAYTDADERDRRFEIFRQNVEYIEAFNNANSSDKEYDLAVNQFADLTNEEFKALRNSLRMKYYMSNQTVGKRSFRYENVTKIPASVDWRKKGAVTSVKDQGECSSCWAFSAVAAIEGLMKLTTSYTVSLSEQQLIDCDTKGFNHGCNYGLMDAAFKFIHHNHGLASDQDYPYKGKEGKCKVDTIDRSHMAKIGGFEDLPRNDENALLKAVANLPVSVVIDSSDGDFQFYSSGVFTGKCGTNYDHALTIVGYGTTKGGTKYWLAKNSWGRGWGEDGYLRIQRGVKAKEGKCGIAMLSSYPVV
ncbi:ervatamin-B-like [Punica granatum]|uniref:Ervatamin-B-like n=1 Tax=Punica granatum TaxID=22663 RepID=A0A6P8DNV2_PUNGR|nr:ervatamin-B-like [Punica granatum]